MINKTCRVNKPPYKTVIIKTHGSESRGQSFEISQLRIGLHGIQPLAFFVIQEHSSVNGLFLSIWK